MRNLRPKNLNLFTIRFPLPAIISILHRISGFILFFMIPIFLWLLSYSLTLEGFETIKVCSYMLCFKMLIWLFLVPFCFHLVAGIRHLLMDVHVGESLVAGRRMSGWVIVLSVFCVALIGIWLW